jgi:hypothetical protein
MTFASSPVAALDRSPRGLAVLFAGIERQLIAADTLDGALTTLTTTAVAVVPGAQYAGITLARSGKKFTTMAPTDEVVGPIDAAQYKLKRGPCVDAVLHDRVFRADDLRTDTRWPVFGEIAARHGVLSMLSIRLFLPEDTPLLVGLNLYATDINAFDDDAETIAVLLATHGALAVSGVFSRDKARHLEIALQSNREIGAAMGILMDQYKINREQAFTLLRIASQDTNRKVAALATEVVDSGRIDLPARLR